MSIVLAIDYGTGTTKTFSAIPHHDGMGVDDVLEAAKEVGPSLSYAVRTGMVNSRFGFAPAHLEEIDGVAATEGTAWRLTVDGEPVHWSLKVGGHPWTDLPKQPVLSDGATVAATRVRQPDA